jgi:single-strand DNA-binding protein
MNFNKAFILGNVTRDPETRALPSGQSVASFGIASNRFYTDQSGQKKQDAEFHNVVAFGKLADIVTRYVTKGTLVFIEGRIKTRNWQNQQGVKQYRTEIVAETLQLGPRGMGGTGGGSYPKQASNTQDQTSKQEDIPVIEENNMPPPNFVTDEGPKNSEEININDIPF